MPNEQRFKPGEKFDPNEALVVHESQLHLLGEHYPEIAQLVRQQPSWQSKTFIVFPASPANGRLLRMLAKTEPGSSGTKNHPHSVLDGKTLVAVVIHQTSAYRDYDPLYTWRLRPKR